MKTPTRSPKNEGFTLIELLTVIAVVAILVAIIVPTVGAVRKKAHESRATSNLRQLAIAHLTYAAENRNRFPPRYQQGVAPTWQESLFPYLAVKKKGGDSSTINRMRQDPSSIFNVPDSLPYEQRNTAQTSIARNWCMHNAQWDYRPSRVPNPSRAILLGECVEANKDEMTGLAADLVSPASNNLPMPGFRRAGGTKALMAFCDAHVESLTKPQLIGTSAAGESNLWRWW